MKVLLIDPPGNVIGLNSGLGYLAGSLSGIGFFVRVLDFNNARNNVENRLQNELKTKYDVVGFSIKTNTVISASEIAELCKSFSPSSILVAGGPGVSVIGASFLKENPVFEYLILGESENTFLEFLKYSNDSEKLKSVAGLCYKNGDTVIVNETEAISELDRIAFPDFSHFDTINFSKNAYPLVTSRGCPYDCIYCNVSFVSGKRFRARSAENVIAELKLAKERYKINNFQIYDDTFTQDIKRAKQICKLIIDEKLDLEWVCQNGIRADRLDKELLLLMKQAGCQGVWFGVESLDEGVFKNINKGESVKDVIQALEMAREVGIPRSAFFIIGLPGSSYEKDMSTLKKAKKLSLNLATWSLATPYPHTKLWEWAQSHARALRDFRNLSFFVDPQCAFETKDYPEEKRLKVLYKANLAFSRYEVLSADDHFFKRIGKILMLIAKYDPWRFPWHLTSGLILMMKKTFGIKRQ